jgi:2-polyprenyl-3-methyl-5-hydroxy-6-metoxy-1,4-benzoquinol methylase
LALEDTYRAEREKWDAVAQREYDEAGSLPPYADFEDYSRNSTTQVGVTEFLGDLRGKRVLEFGCGLGKMSALLAKSGADVSTFDISESSVAVARRRAELNGLKVDAIVAVGEDLPYPDESFDIVVGKAILHHLDVTRARGELHRVLRPGGKAAFVEPMGMNPLLNFARDHLPYRQKTERGADVPLDYDAIHAWGQGFSEFRYHEVQLLGMVERFFGFGAHFRWLARVDERLLRRLPFLRRYARYVVIYLVK